MAHQRARGASQPHTLGDSTAKAKQLFTQIDTNRSGRVNIVEMREALAKAEVKAALAWPGSAEELVALLAREGHGSFDESQLRHYIEVKDLFNAIDANASGRISSWELETALRRIPDVQKKLGVPPNLCNSLFEQIDTNASGAISLIEFYRYYTAAPLSRPYKPLGTHFDICRRLFGRIDRDGSGGISRQEFIAALRDDPEVQLDLGQPARHADQLFNFLDANQDGEISEKEFRLFCRAQWIFNGIDVNRSGYIDNYELGSAMEDPALQHELGHTVQQSQQLFRAIDARNTGALRFSDFYRWLEKQPEAAPVRPAAGEQRSAPKHEHSKGKDAYSGHTLLAEGAFGKVFKVKRKTDGLMLILKEPKADSGVTMEEVVAEGEMLQRLKHVNILRFVDQYLDGENFIIITEFCEGGDLRKFQKQKPIDPTAGARIFYETCCGMKYLHDRGILHRDLKPDNILLTASPMYQAKIADFGLAKDASNDRRGAMTAVAQTYCGTPFYMAPELHEGQPYGKTNDVWALGCILYEMGTAKLAFSNVADIVRGRIPQDAPGWCAEVVRLTLITEPDRRATLNALLQHPKLREGGKPARGGYSGGK